MCGASSMPKSLSSIAAVQSAPMVPAPLGADDVRHRIEVPHRERKGATRCRAREGRANRARREPAALRFRERGEGGRVPRCPRSAFRAGRHGTRTAAGRSGADGARVVSGAHVSGPCGVARNPSRGHSGRAGGVWWTAVDSSARKALRRASAKCGAPSRSGATRARPSSTGCRRPWTGTARCSMTCAVQCRSLSGCATGPDPLPHGPVPPAVYRATRTSIITPTPSNISDTKRLSAMLDTRWAMRAPNHTPIIRSTASAAATG